MQYSQFRLRKQPKWLSQRHLLTAFVDISATPLTLFHSKLRERCLPDPPLRWALTLVLL